MKALVFVEARGSSETQQGGLSAAIIRTRQLRNKMWKAHSTGKVNPWAECYLLKSNRDPYSNVSTLT
jgi:hypothetical protein